MLSRAVFLHRYIQCIQYKHKICNYATKMLSDQWRKASFELIRNFRNMCTNPKTKVSLFDCYIGNVVNYVSKMWETHIY